MDVHKALQPVCNLILLDCSGVLGNSAIGSLLGQVLLRSADLEDKILFFIRIPRGEILFLGESYSLLHNWLEASRNFIIRRPSKFRYRVHVYTQTSFVSTLTVGDPHRSFGTRLLIRYCRRKEQTGQRTSDSFQTSLLSSRTNLLVRSPAVPGRKSISV